MEACRENNLMHGTHGEIGVLETLELVRMSHLCSSENASRIVPGECSGTGVTRRTVGGQGRGALVCVYMRMYARRGSLSSLEV